jgi:hypothetical protein
MSARLVTFQSFTQQLLDPRLTAPRIGKFFKLPPANAVREHRSSRKLRCRQPTDDSNVEISGRDLRAGAGSLQNEQSTLWTCSAKHSRGFAQRRALLNTFTKQPSGTVFCTSRISSVLGPKLESLPVIRKVIDIICWFSGLAEVKDNVFASGAAPTGVSDRDRDR